MLQTIRINVPQLTEERRNEMTKLASAAGEDAKVAVRNIRRDVLKNVSKQELSEDDEKAIEKEIQKVTDQYIKKVESLIEKKNKDLKKV
jgi:ribosome recycling factor